MLSSNVASFTEKQFIGATLLIGDRVGNSIAPQNFI